MVSPEEARDAFRLALERLYPKIFKLAMHLSGNVSEAEDLVHDAMERALRARRQFCFGENPERWLRTIVQHLFLDQRRRARRRPECPAEQALAVAATAPTAAEAGDRPWWEVLTERDVRRASVRLAPALQEILILRVGRGLSYAQIARALGVTANTVGTRLLRARRQLREILEREGTVEIGPGLPVPAGARALAAGVAPGARWDAAADAAEARWEHAA